MNLINSIFFRFNLITKFYSTWVVCSPTDQDHMRSQYTYNDITPELSHLPYVHGHEQGLPDIQFKHVPDHHFHGHTCLLTVIYHGAIIIAELGAEMERHL